MARRISRTTDTTATVARVPTDTSEAVEVEGLTVRYGPLLAVDNLSFSASRGQVVALLGPNGAGKTSTVETLEGYREAEPGTVRVLGLDPARQHRRLTPRLGVMLQEGGVYPTSRPREILRLFASYYERPRDPDELIDRVGLGDRRRSSWRSLSGGEKQRLSLALALVGRPEVVFLDEPTAGVDVAGRQVIRQIIRELRDESVCVLLTTHDLEDIEKLADRVVIIDRGALVADGSPGELTRDDNDEVLFGAPPGLDTASLGITLEASVTETTPGEYCLAAEGTPAVIAALTAWLAEHDLPLADLRAGRKRLEDVFLRLTDPDRPDR